MKTNQTIQAAGFAGIITLLVGASVMYFSFIQQMMDFVSGLPVAGIHH